MRQTHQTSRGVSIVETIVTIGLVSMFMVTAIGYILFTIRANHHATATQELSWHASQILMHTRERSERADAIVVPAVGEIDSRIEFENKASDSVEEVALYSDSGFFYSAEDSDEPERIWNDAVTVVETRFRNISTDVVEAFRAEIELQVEDATTTFYATFIVSP